MIACLAFALPDGAKEQLIDTKTVRWVRKAHAKRDLQPATVEERAKIK
jgi:hypothetical protein